MKSSLSTLGLFLLISSFLQSQSFPAPTPANKRMEILTQRKELKDNSWFNHLSFQNIGPTVFSGRVVDVDVNPANPIEMYVAYASGGVWYTNNNGTTLTPIFDSQATITIGDIAVNWSNNIIWVGSGENNSSRSSYSGIGIFKSNDKGKTWKHMGLAESQHIGRIVLHPVNQNIVHVACLGSLYSDNENRGVYTTADGGVTWSKTLYVNPTAGAVDLTMDPNNPNVLFTAIWERTRRAWNFTESGAGTGIYKSTDSGKTWELLTNDASGFPIGKGAGRIGLECVRIKNETVVYAVIDNQDMRPKEEPKTDDLTKDQLRTMSKETFLKLEEEKVQNFLADNGFPEKYTVDTVMTLIKTDKITPVTLVEYLEDANSLLFDTQVIGAEVYKSMDGGKTWAKTHDKYLNNLFYTYGYYFGQIRVSHSNPQKIYILGVPALKSEDGGATWKAIDGDNVHGDHHALWLDPKQDGHLVLGNDGGLNITYDDGKHWIKCNQPSVGQFYSIALDMAKPYNVYGGLQDNGVWVGPSNYTPSDDWQSSGRYPYKSILGGDGMQVAVDSRDNATTYTGFQFGNYYKVSRTDEEINEFITPQHELGQRPYRWNWETPIHLSVHNQDILYMGAERVFRSFNQGENFTAISGDLTKGGKKGDVSYGTLTSLTESPLQFGLIYAGSDDGYIHVTRDAGVTWKRVSDALPKDLWVSSVQASKFVPGRVYISLNGYRWDMFDSYVYVSEDYGDHWLRIANDLPFEPVNVVKEDPVNPDILYIGTDQGLYVSLNRGLNLMSIGDLPSVAVHDLAIHPRDHELVIATHGRSFYKCNVAHLEKMNPDMPVVTCFDEKLKSRFSSRWGNRSAEWMDYYDPHVDFPVFSADTGKAILEVYADSLLLHTEPIHLNSGLSYYQYHLNLDEGAVDELTHYIKSKDPKAEPKMKKRDNEKYYLPPGKYIIKIRKDGADCSLNLEIK
jgi:photosystem II stability/assembly factor-like uncharacterized protein